MVLIPTLYGHCEGEDRGATLSAIKHKRRLGKQVAISKKCKRRRESIAPTHFRQYQPLATIYEENEIGTDMAAQDEIFCQKDGQNFNLHFLLTNIQVWQFKRPPVTAQNVRTAFTNFYDIAAPLPMLRVELPLIR